MPPLHRLPSCLLMLVLVAGMLLQARTAAAMPEMPQPTSGEVASLSAAGCHEAVAPPRAEPAPATHAGHGESTGAAADCCDDASPDACGSACPCPGAPAALAPACPAPPAATRDPQPQAAGLHGRDRVAEGPPRRPPIV